MKIYQKLILLTVTAQLIKKAIRVHGATSKNNFDFVGLNGRFDTIQAAILLVKLNEFDKEIELRQEKANFYEIDGALNIEEITAKIDAFLNV